MKYGWISNFKFCMYVTNFLDIRLQNQSSMSKSSAYPSKTIIPMNRIAIQYITIKQFQKLILCWFLSPMANLQFKVIDYYYLLNANFMVSN